MRAPRPQIKPDPPRMAPLVQPPLPASLLDRPEFRSERLMAPSRGAARYRRGVYVNVQRTFPLAGSIETEFRRVTKMICGKLSCVAEVGDE